IHTELIGKLGWFEWLFNTPAQHRVHHAVNPRYLDRNYAATLCIWDRLFGTFEEEKEQPVYGLVKPLASFDPIWAQVHHFFEMAKRSREFNGIDKLRVWIKGPEWQHSPAPEITRAEQRKHDVALSKNETIFLTVTLALGVIGTTGLLWYQDMLHATSKILVAVLLLGLISTWGM